MYQVDILGIKFSVQTDEPPERFNSLVDYYQKTAEDLKSKIGTTDPVKTAIIAGIIITDQLFKCRENKGQEIPDPSTEKEISLAAEQMIRKIDEVLDL